MRNLPSDFIAAVNADDAPVSMLVLKLESGDVKFSDGLYGEGLPYIENISEEQDGGSFENYLSRGNLETCKLSVTLIYSDLSRSTIHSVISELQSMSADNLRCRAELWKKFVDIDGNDTCAPLLWNVYAVQDNSENFACREDQMLFPLELITLPGSENQKLSITNDPEKSYDYVIGKAEGLSLQLMEEESSKWTELIGDEDGNEVTAEYTGLIRVKDASKLRLGYHLINGEYVYLSRASAGYMRLSQRGSSLTEPQKHSSGSRIFPSGAVFKYAVCLPVGSFDKLRTSNEIDVYDDDGDGNTTEYRDLYSGGNEDLRPGLNPAQIWFDDRMPFLWKDQENQIDDKVFYGTFSGFSDATMVEYSIDVNVENGKPRIKIPFQAFSLPSTDIWYRDTTIPVPAMPSESSYGASQNIIDNTGYFSVSQQTGEYDGTDYEGCSLTSTAYREFRINGTCPAGEIGWTIAAPDLPEDEGFFAYAPPHYWAIVLQSVVTSNMDFSIRISQVDQYGNEGTILSSTFLGKVLGGEFVHTCNYTNSNVLSGFNINSYNRRIKIALTCLDKGADSNSYAFVRIGGRSAYSDKIHYGMAMFWRYYDNAPSAWLSSIFGKNLSSRGVFISAKAKIKGKIKNTNDFSTGTLKILDGATEKYSTSVTDGSEIDTTIELSAATWGDLSSTTVKVVMQLDYLGKVEGDAWKGVPRIAGEAGFDFDGGIQWLLTYTSTTLDGLQVNYADTLYVDAVSTRGADWTPARAVQYLAADHTSWAGLIDTDSFGARHDEFAAAGHFLNGTISGSSGSQDAIRTVLKEGLAGLNYPLGKITMYSYLTDLATTVPAKSLMSVVRPDRESFPNRGFMPSANEMRSNRMFFRWNKNLSTGKYDGNVIKSDGTVFLNDQVVTFELVKSDTIGNSVANFLWNLWKYGYIIQDCEYPAVALAIEKHDMITSFSMSDDDETKNFIAVSCSQTHESAKARRGLSAKIIMIKR
jgi:hypothetical protein